MHILAGYSVIIKRKVSQVDSIIALMMRIAICILLILPLLFQYPSYFAMASLALLEQQQKYITKNVRGTEHENFVTPTTKRKFIGAWMPNKLPLEKMQSIKQQKDAIDKLLAAGFNEYYFVMNDFRDSHVAKSTENLLKSADRTLLKIIIILLPPSEGGPNGNYDWKSWINYFNTLKDIHESFQGFAIDDFNWISTRNDTAFKRNIDYMTYSNLSNALNEKRKDLEFYPVIYFEGLGTDIAIKEYNQFTGGIILVSASYYNITGLEKNLVTFRKMFYDKPIRYVVYPTITYNYTRQHYNHPSDQLIMATLSIATRTVDGILIWHKINSPVVEDYLSNRHESRYLSKISVVEERQIRDETITQLVKGD